MISIVIPVFNNNETLQELTARIAHALTGSDYEVLYIDDGSTDGSLQTLKSLANEHGRIRIISFSRNFGQHPAISAGFEHAQGDKIILMDADLQDRPENIPLLLRHMRDGIEIVHTVRIDTQKRVVRDATSNFFHRFLSRQLRVGLPPNIGTFTLFSRKVLLAMLRYREVNIMYGALLYSLGFKRCFVEVQRDERTGLKSSYNFSKRLELALNTLITYTNLPYVIFSYTGLILLFCSVLYALLVIVQYMFLGRSLPGGLTIIVVLLSFTLGSLIFSIGILGSYLYRIFQEVLRRPRYLIDEMIGNNPETEK